MKKIRGILIFLATLAIFGISFVSFAKTERFFSSQANHPSYSTIKEYQDVYDALGGSPDQWNGNSLEEARISVEKVQTWIANIRKLFGSRDQAWTGFPWTGRYDNPHTLDETENTPTFSETAYLYIQVSNEIHRLKTEYLAQGGASWTGTYDDPDTQGIEKFPTLSEAQTLHSQLVAEIARLKTEYDALGGSESDWKGSYQSTPTLSEAQALVELILTKIANWRKILGSGEQTWTGFPWAGSGSRNTPILSEAQTLHDDAVAEIQRLKTNYLARGGKADDWIGSYGEPATPNVDETTPNLSEAQNLHNELIAEIQRLKTEYLDHGGEANDWTGTYDDLGTPDVETTPTLSEAQALVQLLKKPESSKTLIIGVSTAIGGALLLGGLGYWFYRRRQKN